MDETSQYGLFILHRFNTLLVNMQSRHIIMTTIKSTHNILLDYLTFVDDY